MSRIIEPGTWVNAYHFWLSERGSPMKVKPIKHVGFKGWDNYIYRKENNGTIYCGDIWLCENIFGEKKEYVFRTEYSDDIEEIKWNYNFKKTYDPIHREEVNALCDGFEAYIYNDYKKRNTDLLKNEQAKLSKKIETLTTKFKELNNFENRLLKLGIQLYLNRLQTPTMATSKAWKEYSQEHPYLKTQIMELI